jgi:hypothetical protein
MGWGSILGSVAGSFFGGPAGGAIGGSLGGMLDPSTSNKGGPANQGAAAAADPFASQRPQYQQQLSSLMADPSSVSKLPGYQFQLDQGVQAVDRAAGAKGMLGSGNRLAELMHYGQGLASDFYGKQVSTLSQLSGANIGSPAAAAGIIGQQQGAAAAGGAQLGSLIGQNAGAMGSWLGDLMGSGGASSGESMPWSMGGGGDMSSMLGSLMGG